MTFFVLALSALGIQPLEAQRDTLRWRDGVGVVGGLALASVFDEAVQHATQEARSPTGDRIAATARHMGQPEVFVTVPVAAYLAGALSKRPALRRAGERIAGSLALAGVLVTAGKFTLGRVRPFASEEPYDFRPFSGADAFPSGHTTMAFALATAIANEVRRPAATVALLAAASATGWSRLNDNKHWFSDVVAGAALGVTSAQLMDRRWSIGRVRPPGLVAAGGNFGLGWQVPLRLREPAQRFQP